MKFSKSIFKIIVCLFLLKGLNVCLAQDCEYRLNIYARSVFFKHYETSSYKYLQNYVYPHIKYIPFYGGISYKGGYDSVVLFYAAEILYDKSLFDTSKYFVNNRKHHNKKNHVRAIIKDGCTAKEVWVMKDYSVLIDDVSYNMTNELINFLGKHIPFTLRDNWEIHYNYVLNKFYLGSYESPLKIETNIENIDE